MWQVLSHFSYLSLLFLRCVLLAIFVSRSAFGSLILQVDAGRFVFIGLSVVSRLVIVRCSMLSMFLLYIDLFLGCYPLAGGVFPLKGAFSGS